MKQKGLKTFLVLGILGLCPFLISSDNYKVVNGPPDFYYGHISLVDIKNDGKDPLIFREGVEKPEIAAMNLPLGPGDTIRTSDERRCEIQFDNATILRLDTNTELKIETILAQSLSSMNKLSNLVLRRGRIYVMYKQYNSKEMFQVITPNTAVKLRHDTVATIGYKEDNSYTDVQVEYGKASVLFGPEGEKQQEKTVYKSERFTVLKDNTFLFGETMAFTDFDAWCKAINKDFLDLHKGVSTLPKPIQRLPKAVFYFAQTFGNLYGEWVYDDFYGYVWRPFYNDYYPWGSWQPYFYGRWSAYGGQMYWVPEEPWGWVPYHLGVWQWDDKRGWYWLPGSAFAPAWVDWAFFSGSYFAWRPWTLWDWMYYDKMMFYGYGFFDSYYDWPMVYRDSYPGVWTGDGSNQTASKQAINKIFIGQLRRPSGQRPFEMPKELGKAYKALLGALKKGDPQALASLKSISKHTLVVSAADLNTPKIQGKAVGLESFMKALQNLPSESPQKVNLSQKPQSAESSARSAARSYERNMQIAGPRNPAAGPGGREALTPLTRARAVPSGMKEFVPLSSTRVHDWNPDARISQRLGVNILYSSRMNQIYSPQLHLTSSMVGNSPILRASRSGSGDGSNSGGYSASGGTSSGSGASSAGSTSTSGSSSSSSSSSSSGTSSGHIR